MDSIKLEKNNFKITKIWKNNREIKLEFKKLYYCNKKKNNDIIFNMNKIKKFKITESNYLGNVF